MSIYKNYILCKLCEIFTTFRKKIAAKISRGNRPSPELSVQK